MHSFLINRVDRPDRLSHAKEQLRQQQWNAHLFLAHIDSPGWKGCTASHLDVLEHSRKYKTVCIFEDDILFLHDRETVQRVLADALEEMPRQWDALYLGASPQEPQERYSDSLFRLKNSKCSQAIIWHNRKDGAVDYILSHRNEIKKFDRFLWEEVMPKFNVFCTFPMLVTQMQSKSDIARHSDCSSILTNYNRYCI